MHKELTEEVIQIGGVIHLAFVTDDDPQKFRTGCGHGWGEWITGNPKQVNCDWCKINYKLLINDKSQDNPGL